MVSAQGTDAHQALARIAVEFKLLPVHAGSLIWQIPLLSAGLPLGVIIDRELRRSRMTLILYRITAVVLLAAAAVPLLNRALAGSPWFEYAAILLPLTGMGLLFLTLWLQSWCVAYFCPDPPELETGRPSLLGRVLGPVARLFGSLSRLLRRRPAGGEDEESAKPRRRRKKADTETEAAPAAARRKRKAPAKRTTKPRTRTRKVEEEAEAEAPDESSNWVEETAADESWNGSSAAADDASEWSEPEETTPSRKASSSAKSSSGSRHTAREPEEESSASEEWSDDEGNDYRVDGPPADQLRGLSKKQRRDLRKQWKDQQRSG